jgi:hypothetical protein
MGGGGIKDFLTTATYALVLKSVAMGGGFVTSVMDDPLSTIQKHFFDDLACNVYPMMTNLFSDPTSFCKYFTFLASRYHSMWQLNSCNSKYKSQILSTRKKWI